MKSFTTQAKAEAAIKTIIETAPKSDAVVGNLKFLHLDLNDLLSVKSAAETFAQQEPKLDVLWNNAGTGANGVAVGQRTAQDFEPMIGMHCIATLLFTELLLPQLRAAAASASGRNKTRVIWTASALVDSASLPNGIDFNALEKGSPSLVRNYSASKAGTWILGREFARRYGDKDGIVSVTVNPGNVRAASYDGSSRVLMFFINALMLHNTVLGGYTELYAGLSQDLTLENNGAYVIPWGRIRPDADNPRDDILAALTPVEEGGLDYGPKFWAWCEEQWMKYV